MFTLNSQNTESFDNLWKYYLESLAMSIWLFIVYASTRHGSKCWAFGFLLYIQFLLDEYYRSGKLTASLLWSRFFYDHVQ